MSNETLTFDQLASDLRKLKVLLVLLTVIQFGWAIIYLVNIRLWFELMNRYRANYLLAIPHVGTVALFIWYNWRKLPVSRKQKKDFTYMMLFLGIIGMWLWLPNKQQLDMMRKQQEQ